MARKEVKVNCHTLVRELRLLPRTLSVMKVR